MMWHNDTNILGCTPKDRIKSHNGGPLLHNRTNAPLTEPTKAFREAVQRVYQQGKNGLMIYEAFFVLHDEVIRSYAEYLKPMFEVQIIVTHRYLFEWLPSKRYQNVQQAARSMYTYKAWPQEPNHKPFDIENRSYWSDYVDMIEETGMHPAQIVQQNYGLHFAMPKIFDMGNLPPSPDGVDSVLNGLFCHVLSMPSTCRAIHEGKIGKADGYMNPSQPLYFDLPALAAHEQGLVPSTSYRHEVRERIQTWHTKTKGKTNDKFPVKCLPNATLDRLERLSLTVSKNLFGTEWTREREADHQTRFKAKVNDRKTYCSIDTDKVLADPEWRAFLATMQ